MVKYRELLFLQSLKGIGKTTIHKKYLPDLFAIDYKDDLFSLVLKNNKKLSEEDLQEAWDKTEKPLNPGVTAITILDEAYPEKLKVMKESAPLILYVRGNVEVLSIPGIAIVGTREPSPWSEKVEEQLVEKILSLREITVISGLAMGCDRIAHKTTVKEHKKTVAVLPSGVNVITPSSHSGLAEEIIKTGGCLVSEYEPDTIATRYSFVERDSLIAALSDATYVVECGIKSGTMHTAQAAQKYSRPIACYKCDDSGKGNYEGNNHIISEMNGCAVSGTEELVKFLETALP